MDLIKMLLKELQSPVPHPELIGTILHNINKENILEICNETLIREIIRKKNSLFILFVEYIPRNILFKLWVEEITNFIDPMYIGKIFINDLNFDINMKINDKTAINHLLDMNDNHADLTCNQILMCERVIIDPHFEQRVSDIYDSNDSSRPFIKNIMTRIIQYKYRNNIQKLSDNSDKL